MTKTGQKTGRLKISKKVQNKLMMTALVALCQNLNSGSLLMKGRNSSSAFVGRLDCPPSRPSSSVESSEGSNLGCRKARNRFRM